VYLLRPSSKVKEYVFKPAFLFRANRKPNRATRRSFIQIMQYGVVLFSSTHLALRAEKLTKGENLPVKLIPVPRHLSSDCGVCLRFSWDQKREIEETLNQAGVQTEGVHSLD